MIGYWQFAYSATLLGSEACMLFIQTVLPSFASGVLLDAVRDC